VNDAQITYAELEAERDRQADAVARRNWTYDEAEAFRAGWDAALTFVAWRGLQIVDRGKTSP